jgi:hypothetical protein
MVVIITRGFAFTCPPDVMLLTLFGAHVCRLPGAYAVLLLSKVPGELTTHLRTFAVLDTGSPGIPIILQLQSATTSGLQ